MSAIIPEEPMTSLEGRTALVTGGSRGIGAAICLELANRGADIAINYHANLKAADEVAAAVRKLGRRAETFAADIGVEAEAEDLAAQALKAFGSIDILVNNAGIGSAAVGRPLVVDTTIEKIDWHIRTHVYGPLVLCRALVPQMRTRGRGDVIMISSIAAQSLGVNMGTYNVAKAGMEALAMTLAKEERQHGIRVNIVAPGLVDTDMGLSLMKFTAGVEDMRTLDARMPFGYVCTPGDIANSVAFLVGEEGRYITGQRFTVNGGTF
jgi:NAD(P)-dependent dehydrogenase (short-subunit alcohol dehydrogenase family)